MTPVTVASVAIAAAVVLFNVVFVVMRLPSLPDRMPVHFGIRGKPDRWAGRNFVWFYPAMSVVIAAFMTLPLWIMHRKPHAVDAEMIAMLSAYIAVINLVLTSESIAIAQKRREGLGWWFIPVMLVGMLLILLRSVGRT